MNPSIVWGALLLSLLMLAAYEFRTHYVGQRNPEQIARYANAQIRVHWVAAMSAQPGFEVAAVQALRNSLMSATISASTAALGTVAAVTLAGATLVTNLPQIDNGSTNALHTVLQGLLVLSLFSSYVCSAMAMRYFSHAGFVMSMPVAAPDRLALNPVAAEYVRRAGLLYSWGLRLFLMVAPLVAGVVHPMAMPPATVILLVALHYFDQSAPLVQVH